MNYLILTYSNSYLQASERYNYLQANSFYFNKKKLNNFIYCAIKLKNERINVEANYIEHIGLFSQCLQLYWR